jgi:hypothetical protein
MSRPATKGAGPADLPPVFATLAEAVSAKEWFDGKVQLPEGYRGLIPARTA